MTPEVDEEPPAQVHELPPAPEAPHEWDWTPLPIPGGEDEHGDQ